MDNGIGLTISSIGSRSVFDFLMLNNVLHISVIKNNLINLISVTQFTRDNNVYFDFFPNGFLMKDVLSRKVFLQGRIKNGLYNVDIPKLNIVGRGSVK